MRGQEIVIMEETPRLVGRHLTGQIWDMKTKLKETETCPICLEELCCKSCFTVLLCGHYMHRACWEDAQLDVCPVCRQ
jgi:hypothetical protein